MFISYARADADAVSRLRDNLVKQDHPAFFDQEIRGGQDWWEVILENIRACPIFLFVLSPDSARSRACLAELKYAADLGKAIVPINVRPYKIEEAPERLQQSNILKFINPDVGDYNELDTILDGHEDAPPELPAVLPDPPPTPIADLTSEREMLESDSLGPREQRELVASLGAKVGNPDDRPAVVALLDKLKRRDDVTVAVAEEATELLARHRQPPSDAQSARLLRSVVKALDRKACVPILGSGMTNWLVGSRKLLAQEWAQQYNYPLHLGRRDDLPQVAQYISVTEKDAVMREDLGEFYRTQLASSFPDAVNGHADKRLDDIIVDVWKHESGEMVAEPHRVLAGMPCKIYITAQPTGLLREALIAQGKSPREDFCRWKEEAEDDWPPSPFESQKPYKPSVAEPLVFHVFGTLDYSDSIVITEDDYFDFLGAVAEEPDLIPHQVRELIAESSLLFLGFGLQDWDVRVLLRALVSPQIADDLERKKHVAAEIDPADNAEFADGAREYLKDYFGRGRKPSIDIFWSSVEAFCEGLQDLWAGRVEEGAR
ncbi:MAG: TIR domain-containing protein [Ilumatobacter sp.]|uniref:TIR domain-containing protein n=1 Tax=Ilumatobacter sp. TaxID=1967498 RepID=UPI00262301D0|nr:TIR domain-containing protein [Ilumatobacter sp.]MDJ0769180.1 TIR domain-containing protein [Ilumatobacter sp.]